MSCRICGHDNPDEARFCNACGGVLVPRCPSCKAENPAGSRFCNVCGGALDLLPTAPERAPRTYTPKHLADKILASRSALEGERKQVTVLFADVRGSMELAESVDPEEWHQILDKFFSILADGIHRFEGTVNQYTGDGIMALFGAPIAHEDLAQRACYAALHLREALRKYADELRLERGLNFSVRMGLNSGEVVVGKIGDDLRMDYTAQGHVVGVAARMQALAEAGHVLLADATAQLASGYFDLRPLGAMRVKGVAAAQNVFELETVGRAQTRFDISRSRGLSTFVDRSDEMATLDAALARAVAGQGCVVGVVAEAGTGKSRLCFEFTERARARNITVREAHAVLHGRSVALLPILALLRALFGLDASDDPDQSRQKIAGALVLLDASFERWLPFWFDFLGVPDPARPAPAVRGEDGERVLLEGLRRLIVARSRQDALVLLLEDLHWFDSASLRAVESLVDAVADTHTLLVLNFRPEFRADWMSRHVYRQLPLVPLGPEAVAGLIADLLGPHPSIAPIGTRIAARAAGNPFFVEELVRALAEHGRLTGGRGAYVAARADDALELPDSVQAVLAARIDRLDERDKDILQAAAVIGLEFDVRVLVAVANRAETEVISALRTLTHGELTQERSLYPDMIFAFKHPLTHEVALRTQLAARRTERHAAAARAIEAMTPAERLDEQAALLAHHWAQAGSNLEAARWHSRAGRSVRLRTPLENLKHQEVVRSLCATLPQTQETLNLALTAVWQLVLGGFTTAAGAAEARRLVHDARRLAARGADPVRFVDVLSACAMFRAVGDIDYAEALAVLAEAEAAPAIRADAALAIRFNATKLLVLRESGRLADAHAVALRLPTEFDARDTFGATIIHGNRGRLNFWLGRVAVAEREIELGIDAALRAGGSPVVWYHFLTDLAAFRGDAVGAERFAARAIEGAMPESSHDERVSVATLGIAHAAAGRWQEATAAYEHSLSLPLGSGFARVLLAEALLELGDHARALRTAADAIAESARIKHRIGELHAQRVMASVLRRSQGMLAATPIVGALARAEFLLGDTGAIIYAPSIHLERAAFAKLSGDGARYRDELESARRLFAEFDPPIRAADVARELAMAAR